MIGLQYSDSLSMFTLWGVEVKTRFKLSYAFKLHCFKTLRLVHYFFQLRDLTQVIVKEYFALVNHDINEVCSFIVELLAFQSFKTLNELSIKK